MNPFKSIVHAAGRWYINRLCEFEAQAQASKAHNERPVEFRFALEAMTRNQPATVLDVGSGTTSWPHLLWNCGYKVTAIDNVRDYWPNGMINRHWRVLDVDIVRPSGFQGPFDAATCISVIEHIEDHAAAIANMVALVKPGGTLVITTPYNHHIHDPNVYARKDAVAGDPVPYKCRSTSARELESWLGLGLSLERRELWRMYSGPVWFTGERIPWRQAASEDEPHQLGLFEFRRK